MKERFDYCPMVFMSEDPPRVWLPKEIGDCDVRDIPPATVTFEEGSLVVGTRVRLWHVLLFTGICIGLGVCGDAVCEKLYDKSVVLR